MFTTYVLYSKDYNKIYIGYTSDLEHRMVSHNQKGAKGYTCKFRPWTVVHTEVFNIKSDAMKREKELKSARGRKFIREEVISKII